MTNGYRNQMDPYSSVTLTVHTWNQMDPYSSVTLTVYTWNRMDKLCAVYTYQSQVYNGPVWVHLYTVRVKRRP